jgi:hypothetical protein
MDGWDGVDAMAGTMSGTSIGLVRPEAWPVIAAVGGPGRLDPFNPASAMIFDTASGTLRGDALAWFFASEIKGLDWLQDYLMDASVLLCEQDHGPSFEVEPEPEEEYEKKALTMTDTDPGWDIT